MKDFTKYLTVIRESKIIYTYTTLLLSYAMLFRAGYKKDADHARFHSDEPGAAGAGRVVLLWPVRGFDGTLGLGVFPSAELI